MFDPRYLVLIPGLPLLACVLITFLGPRLLRQFSHWPCVLACIASCVLSFLVLFTVGQGETRPLEWTYYTWFAAGDVNLDFALRADGLTSIMLVTVTFVGSLIAIYSAGYMHGDPGYPRFFAEVSLFIFSMTGLVLARNFFLLYAFWEGVGVCSYLLIGFWFARPAAAAAARKAFLVTRLGDIGLFIGILLLFLSSGYTFEFDQIFARAGDQASGYLTIACLLLFCGAAGKSAQFPLHVWLPDAMEGPTPVSALIHAATMVTAGVYLVARSTPLFVLVPTAQVIVASIGAFTALIAGITALTQNDLKRVLAYSTISQLGYMFLALGSATLAGTTSYWVGVAVVAAIFHLFTHAFFKALLFLAAGSVMHAMGNVIDMRRFGGLRRVLPYTHITFLFGACALAAVPLFSGFWSKDEILGAVWGATAADHPNHQVYYGLFAVALLTAGLTAFYTFRAYFLTFWGEERIPHEAGHHAHESPPLMTIPLLILAAGALLVGYVNASLFRIEWLDHFLTEHTPALQNLTGHQAVPTLLIGLAGIATALIGIALAYLLYVAKPGTAARLAAVFPRLYQLSLNKLYFDEIYNFFIVQPATALAEICRHFDLRILDGLVDLIGLIPRLFGYLFRPIQNGLAQFYGLAMALGLAMFLIALARYLGQ
jgi:NADH-quinone oxidoreductase subunit L